MFDKMNKIVEKRKISRNRTVFGVALYTHIEIIGPPIQGNNYFN